MMGAEVNSVLSLSKAGKQAGVNSKGTCSARRSNKGLENFEKFLIKRRQNPAWPKKDHTSRIVFGGSNFEISFTLALSTSMPFTETMCPKTIPEFTMI